MKSTGALPAKTRLGVAVLACLVVLGASAAQAADCVRPKGLTGTTPHIIKFDIGSIEISPEEQAWLKAEADRFATNPSLQVCVIGQADKTGDTELNKKLSMERADAVATFLKDSGLAEKKFQVIGRGEAFGDTKDPTLVLYAGSFPAEQAEARAALASATPLLALCAIRRSPRCAGRTIEPS